MEKLLRLEFKLSYSNSLKNNPGRLAQNMFRKSHYLFLKSKYKIEIFGITQKIDKKIFVQQQLTNLKPVYNNCYKMRKIFTPALRILGTFQPFYEILFDTNP